MIKTVLLGIVLLVAGVLVYENGSRISDAQVREYMRMELEAMRRYDSATLCEAMADDFHLRSVEHAGGVQQRTEMGRADACTQLRDGLAAFETLSQRTGGLLGLDIAMETTRIEILPGGRRARVEATSTAKIADRLIWRTRAKGELSRSLWRIRDHGGEAQTWTYLE
ncbi:hypothetical protein [Luteimonas deserti]|uniref:Nuclear transport factor 2 family protein n=1 Tax=Luteimonas deserti TaxID=2752306 RepID=A0A7Z0TXP1_9GAMM|nr:hypothetical protein [Luteimonas deserti]NYZ61567.1 hypothetical protein [Luteimonas deserti]